MDNLMTIYGVNKPVIGMLHLDYLEGESFKGVDSVISRAKSDIEALQNGGIDGILIENWKEDSAGEFVSKETADVMMSVVMQLKKYIKVPFGINVLNNDYKVAYSTAAASGASYVQLDVLVDEVQSDFSYSTVGKKSPFQIKVDPKKVTDYVRSIGMKDLPLFCFVQPKHYIMLNKGKSLSKSVAEAEENGVTGILVTKATGIAPTLELICQAKNATKKMAIGIGSGFSIDNANKIFPFVDFAVVGSSLKFDGDVEKQVDIKRVERLMNLIKETRKQIE